jgi:hypothetical protein
LADDWLNRFSTLVAKALAPERSKEAAFLAALPPGKPARVMLAAVLVPNVAQLTTT